MLNYHNIIYIVKVLDFNNKAKPEKLIDCKTLLILRIKLIHKKHNHNVSSSVYIYGFPVKSL